MLALLAGRARRRASRSPKAGTERPRRTAARVYCGGGGGGRADGFGKWRQCSAPTLPVPRLTPVRSALRRGEPLPRLRLVSAVKNRIDPLVDFLAKDPDIYRRFDADADPPAAVLQDRYPNVIANPQRLSDPSS